MSRSGYSDDCFEQWDIIRWRGAVASAMRGTRGQDFLKELVDALDALPSRRLISDTLQAADGEVCALGAIGISRRINMDGFDPEEPGPLAGKFGIAEAMAAEIVYMNDEWFDRKSPEQRWLAMRHWIIGKIKDWHNPESDYFLNETG